MELAAFAAHILFSPDLEAKLLQPPVLTDRWQPPQVAVPPGPTRPARLALPPPGVHQRALFPTLQALASPRARATVLHFFANHELLALELMALALLRFPAAPTKFRRGLAATMLEEQKHFQLYLNRLRVLGGEFGEVPVNRYFWDTMAPARSPLEFVAQMALTFEQANLDYSRYFRDQFLAVGDADTAAIMDLVYREEIGHVRHGQVWFDAWRPAGEDAWTSYLRLLPPPLTPKRAKGKVFYVEPRRAAGLSPGFIQELAMYQETPGRLPTLYWFSPGFEDEIAAAAVRTEPRVVAALRADLGTLPLFVARPDDRVWVERLPSSEFLSQLAAYGFSAPAFLTGADLAKKAFQALAPWGVSPATTRQAAALQLSVQVPLKPTAAALGAKSWAKELLWRAMPELACGAVCRDMQAACEAVQRYHGRAIVKSFYGTAGRQQLRLTTANLSPAQRRWLQQRLTRHGGVVVEPWLRKVADFSVQMQIDEQRQRVLGITHFLTDARGQYLGHYLGAKFAALPPAVVRAYHEIGGPEQLTSMAGRVASELHAAGYRGPAGIDALVHQTDDGYALYPLVELNPRWTMGRIAMALDAKVHPRVPALWLHLSRRQATAAGYATFAACAAALRAQVPQSWRSGRLASGILATNDPVQASQVLTLLAIGEAALSLVAAFYAASSP